MRKLNFLIVSLTLLFTYCTKEEIWPFYEIWEGPQNYGQVQALRNGEAWEASAYATFFIKEKPNHCGVSFAAFYPDSVLAESFAISYIPAAVGSYKIHNTKGLSGPWYDSLDCSYHLKHDDVNLASYYPDPNANTNRIWVDEIDTIAGTISGRFDVTLEKDPDDKVTKYQHTVRFKNGVFKARHWP